MSWYKVFRLFIDLALLLYFQTEYFSKIEHDTLKVLNDNKQIVQYQIKFRQNLFLLTLVEYYRLPLYWLLTFKLIFYLLTIVLFFIEIIYL